MNPQTISVRPARPGQMGAAQSGADMTPLTKNYHAEDSRLAAVSAGYVKVGPLHA